MFILFLLDKTVIHQLLKMVKSTLILFQIVLASSAILANSVKSGVSKRGLIFIGDFDENYYFISPNSVSGERNLV